MMQTDRRTTLTEARARVRRLQDDLDGARAELEMLELARTQYERQMDPFGKQAKEAVETAITELQDWRQQFNGAVQSFSLEQVGPLAVNLAGIESNLYLSLERLAGAAYHLKRQELGVGDTQKERLEGQPECDAAARQALLAVNANDTRLTVFPDLGSKTAKHFAELIQGYLSDQHVRVYSPRTGYKQFTRK